MTYLTRCRQAGVPWPDYDRVLTRLYVGGQPEDPSDYDDLVAQGITHVIDCRSEARASVADEWSARGVEYLHAGVHDDFAPKPTSWFAKGIDFALPAINGGGTVYVHCAAGINRGPSMAYAILGALGWSARTSWRLIKGNRPIARIAYAKDADRALLELVECDSRIAA